MEYCNEGELLYYIISKQHLNERQACLFFQEIIDALTYLHSKNIVHCDFKPENILLESFGKSMTYKLIDFGISRIYTLDKLITILYGQLPMPLLKCNERKNIMDYSQIFGVKEYFYMLWFLVIYLFVKKMKILILII